MPRSLNATRRERGPRVADERHPAAPDVVGRREPRRAEVRFEVEEPHPVAAAHRDAGVARDRGDALRERRQAGLGRLGLVQRRERDRGARAGGDRVAQRLLHALVRDARGSPGRRARARRRSTGSTDGPGPRRSRGSPDRSRRRSRRGGARPSSGGRANPSLTLAPTTATERASSMRSSAVRSSGSPPAAVTRYSLPDHLWPTALSFFAMLNACQPGMPLTPPPPCVAHEPWYRPLIGVR